MSPASLLNAAVEIENMIVQARADLAAGEAVDLVPLEGKVANIYNEVSGSLSAPRAERADLLAKLDGIMPLLSALEADLTATQRADRRANAG